MKERIIQPKKITTDSFSIPALKQPTPGFDSHSSGASSPTALNKPVVHDISRIPLRRPQTKLTVNQPGDIYEQEADTVAQQVMGKLAQSGNSSSIQRQQMLQEQELQMKPLASSIMPVVQQESAPEEEEEELQMKSLDTSTLQRESVPEEEEEELQMKSLDSSTLQRESTPEEEELQKSPMVQRQAGMAANSDLETSINQARSSGQPMANNIRQPMEQAFGADFSGVKVHTDAQSNELNQSIQARAFTTGQDVFFRQGEYNPGSRGGQELLAHELTHVVQQNGGAVQRSSDSQDLETSLSEFSILNSEQEQSQPHQTKLMQQNDTQLATTPIVSKANSTASIQRKIGFEYEMSQIFSALATPVTPAEKKEFAKQVKRAGRGKTIKSDFTQQTDSQRRNYLGSGELVDNKTGQDMEGSGNEKMGNYRFHALSKKEKIVRGNQFTLEADEGNAFPDGSSMSNTEFVTDAFEEDENGRKALEKALKDFTEITQRITGFFGKRQVVHAAEVAPNSGLVGKVIFPAKSAAGALQVTGAVDLARVPELMKSMNAAENESEETKQQRKDTRDMLGAALGGALGPSSAIGKAPIKAEEAIEDHLYFAEFSNWHPPEEFGSKELCGLLSLIASYIVSADNKNLGYAKTIAPVMARTDFAAMFKLLDRNEQTYFKQNSDALVYLVKYATGDLDMQTDLFPHGIYNDPRAAGAGDQNALEGLTRKQWILGIMNGTDYLTAAHFNENPDLNLEDTHDKKDDLESMGAMGSRTENVDNNRKEAPIFEIRSLGQLATPEQLQERALEIFDYIVSLNKSAL
ncbi:DUF4157 domain-containing protein [Nostoc sp. PA-18-2419]|uniref:eCIS core domain-containing protein n=1 Tax=Nostoc sp. PA-18-2419 TaxID=2575443 RepID=UPI001CB95924|nr:DUF4157 domain-containing protein [Nostoc sp. PA-18-2419]